MSGDGMLSFFRNLLTSERGTTIVEFTVVAAMIATAGTFALQHAGLHL